MLRPEPIHIHCTYPLYVLVFAMSQTKRTALSVSPGLSIGIATFFILFQFHFSPGLLIADLSVLDTVLCAFRFHLTPRVSRHDGDHMACHLLDSQEIVHFLHGTKGNRGAFFTSSRCASNSTNVGRSKQTNKTRVRKVVLAAQQSHNQFTYCTYASGVLGSS